MRRPVPLRQAWKEVERRLATAPRLAVFSDFDGTLAPIVRHPGRARLPRAARRALERLRHLPRLTVGVVSGRSLHDLRRRVGLGGIHYIGTHGVERMSPDGHSRTRVNPGFRRRIREIGDELSQRLGRLPGIYLERKTVSVAVHHRNASPQAAARARRVVRQVIRNHSGRVRLLEGKKVLELLPSGETTKGSAVLETVAGLRRGAGEPPLLIYLGDDSTDESVFRLLGDSDLGIHVGRSQSSRATYSLHSPSAVAGFLRRVEQVAS